MPADKVVFEDDVDAGAKLLALDKQYVRPRSDGPAMWFCDPWDKFYAELSPPGRQPMATIFIGERHCPAGPSRLVIIEASSPSAEDGVSVLTTVIEPGTLLRPPRIVWTSEESLLRNGSYVRYFNGQADGKDSAQLWISYEVDGMGYRNHFKAKTRLRLTAEDDMVTETVVFEDR